MGGRKAQVSSGGAGALRPLNWVMDPVDLEAERAESMKRRKARDEQAEQRHAKTQSRDKYREFGAGQAKRVTHDGPGDFVPPRSE